MNNSMFIETETGALINLATIQNIDHQKEKDGRGCYTGEYEVIAETDQKVYVIYTTNTRREALSIIELIKQIMIDTGHTVIDLPEGIPF